MPGKTDQEDKGGIGRKPAGTSPTASEIDTGAALRSVYQKTVEEAVPDEMLDLLGRLD